MTTVTDYIKEDYTKWKERDKIFISAPTGSGKTYFILHSLLPYAQKQNKKILFLVNRRILKEQMENEIFRLKYDLRSNIQVELYQTLENAMGVIQRNSETREFHAAGYKEIDEYEEYEYVVCDECHYFLTDANYNTNTALSFRWIQDTFECKIRIFMSATMNEFKEVVEKDEEARIRLGTKHYGFLSNKLCKCNYFVRGKIYSYSMGKNYDYMNIHVIEGYGDVVDLIIGDDNKWLIFVDSISRGRKLESELKAKLGGQNKTNSVVMISSDYGEQEESAEEVDKITKENKFSAKILISTSVMDNGINLKDLELRNVIVFADTEDEFIQMLGRKREDGRKIELYICKQSKQHFQQRIQSIRKLQEIAGKYLSGFEEIERGILRENEKANLDKYNEKEKQLIAGFHDILMRQVAGNRLPYEAIRKLFLVYEGTLYLNLLAFQHLENLSQYYDYIMQRFDKEGEDAFLREQLSWLGKNEEEAERILSECRTSQFERDRTAVIETMKQAVNQKMSKEAAIEFKKSINEQLVRLTKVADCEDEIKKKATAAFSKKDRPISKQNMEFLKKFCDIPYIIEEEKGEYTIKVVSE